MDPWEYEEITEENLDEARALTDRIRQEVRSSRIMLPPRFAAFDKSNSGKLTASRFRRALDTLQLRSVQNASEPALKGLCILFKHSDGAHDLIVDYRYFIDATDASPGSVPPGLSPETVALMEMNTKMRHAQIKEAREHIAAMGGRGPEAPPGRIDELIADLRYECDTKRIRIRDFLAPYDTLRKGRIPKSKFKSALHMAGVTCILGPEVDWLAERFSALDDHLQVDYQDFMHAIGGMGVYQIEEKVAQECKQDTGVDPEALEAVLHPMRQQCQLRRLTLDGMFNRFDRNNMKAVTVSQFKSVLKTNGLLPHRGLDDAIEVLHQAFPARHAEKINYVDFINELHSNQ